MVCRYFSCLAWVKYVCLWCYLVSSLSDYLGCMVLVFYFVVLSGLSLFWRVKESFLLMSYLVGFFFSLFVFPFILEFIYAMTRKLFFLIVQYLYVKKMTIFKYRKMNKKIFQNIANIRLPTIDRDRLLSTSIYIVININNSLIWSITNKLWYFAVLINMF